MNPYHHVGRFRSRRRWEHWFKSVTRMTIRHNNSSWVGAVTGREQSESSNLFWRHSDIRPHNAWRNAFKLSIIKHFHVIILLCSINKLQSTKYKNLWFLFFLATFKFRHPTKFFTLLQKKIVLKSFIYCIQNCHYLNCVRKFNILRFWQEKS